MRHVIVLLLSFFLSFSYVFAGDDTDIEHQYGEVQSYDFDLSVESKGASITANWNAFPNDKNMKWYKLVFSQTNDTPTYPEDDARFVGSKSTKTSETIWLPNSGKYYVRICAITHDEERYCSNVEQVELAWRVHNVSKKQQIVKNEAIKKAAVAEKKEDVKPVESPSQEPVVTKKPVEKKPLSSEMASRIDISVAKFIDRIEGKWYSEAEILNTLKNVIARLENLATQDRYHNIANYMIDILEGYKLQYQDEFDTLESILNDF